MQFFFLIVATPFGDAIHSSGRTPPTKVQAFVDSSLLPIR
jgi:hypothetical protein